MPGGSGWRPPAADRLGASSYDLAMPGRREPDAFARRARREGYRARSAYKLLEIARRWPILASGARVLDLGCAPGSWLQVAADRVGPRGLVVGVDRVEVAEPLAPTVHTLVADMTTLDASALVARFGGRFDVILSDLAPDTSGAGDPFLSARLCAHVLDRLPVLLRPGGHLVMKALEGEPFPDLAARSRRLFDSFRLFRPAATRAASREIYLIGLMYRPVAAGSASA